MNSNGIMKKSFLLLVFLLTAVLCHIQAQEFTVGIFKYKVLSDGSVSVAKSDDSTPSGDIIIPESVDYNNHTYKVSSVANWGFRKCDKITSVVLPNTVSSIGYSAFGQNTNLKNISLPKSLKEIGIYAFSSCENLEHIEIPKHVEKIGGSIVNGSNNLKELLVEDGNEFFKVEDGILLNKEGTKMYDYAFGRPAEHLAIPESVKELASSIFLYNRRLKSVKIPDGVTSLPPELFQSCTALENVSLPKELKSIRYRAFYGCTSLNSIAIPASVTKIEEHAFADCSLNEVISYIEEPFQIEKSVFSGNSFATLYVPYGKLLNYISTPCWDLFCDIQMLKPKKNDNSQNRAGIFSIKTDKCMVSLGKSAEFPVLIVNEGTGVISNIDYMISIGGHKTEKHLDLSPIPSLMEQEIFLSMDANSKLGEDDIEITLTKVNGEENKSDYNTIKVKRITVVERPKVWWGYFSESDLPNKHSYGWNRKTDIECAIYIPAGHNVAGSATIRAIRIWLNGEYLPNVTSLKVWISKSLPKNAQEADYVQEVSVESLESGVNEVALTEPFSVNYEALYVGYTVAINRRAYPVKAGKDWTDNSFYFRVSQEDSEYSEWRSQSDGKLALQVLLDGATLEKNSATPSDLGTNYALKGDVASVPVTIYNGGYEPISSITYTITTDGYTSAETTIHIDNISFNMKEVVNIDFPADADFKEYSKTLTITKVNGAENMASAKTASGTLVTVSERIKTVPVVEETTGTWCGWCTRGIVGLEMLNKEFGDDVITIAVHGGSDTEPMKLSEYRYPSSGGYPSCSINREDFIDPYFGSTSNEPFGIKKDVEAALKLSPVGIEVNAEWSDDTKTILNINTTTTFALDITNQPYQIGYVLLEDGLTGSGSAWAQNNFYSGSDVSGDPNLLPLTQLPSRIVGMSFDYVPVAAWDTYYGMTGTLPQNVVHGEKNTYTFRADITGNTNIQNRDNVKVVVFLLNKKNGQIVNAAKCKIGSVDNPDYPKVNFCYEGKSLDNNATVLITAVEDSWDFGEMNCETNPSSNPKNGLVLVTPDGGQEGTAKLEILSNTLNPGMVQWCMGGECVPMTNKTSLEKTFKTDSDGIALVQFDATNIKSEGTLEAKLTATISSETRTVNIKFVYDKTNGISVIYSEDDNAVWYDMNGNRLENAPTRKGVYIRNGKKVVR